MRPENSEVERLCADNRKAGRILGWHPDYTLELGLEKTIEWIRENPERYRRDGHAIATLRERGVAHVGQYLRVS